MGDFPSPGATVTPLFIHTVGRYMCGFESRHMASSGEPAVRTWIANLVVYMPFSLPFPYPVQRLFWLNGSTVTTTNVDCGIYSPGGQKLLSSGSTAMGSASVLQYVALGTPFLLSPGQYYIAWTCDNTTARGQAVSGTADAGRMLGMLQETTGGFGLPATMTPIAWANAWGPSFCGITRTSSGF